MFIHIDTTMPTDLDVFWDQMNWVHRYMSMSRDVNAYLNKEPYDKSGKHWTKKDIKEFCEWMLANGTVLARGRTLYRGTSQDVNEPYFKYNPNRSFVSMTKSEAIAHEFASPKGKGNVHVLHLTKGCTVFDFQPYYASFRIPALKREKEVLLYPGHNMTLMSEKGRVKHWRVEPAS